MSTVLVTGGSGFIGVHSILRLLREGYSVRTTVRDLAREPDVRAMLATGGAEPGDALEFVAADLTRDEGWSEAVAGCEYVWHVASPFPPGAPEHEDELIVPAREGTLRVLRAARDAGVKRVVLTSSFAAIGYGHPPQTEPFDETTWTNPEAPGVPAYQKSKTLAERAAWDFMEAEGGAMELSVVNPVLVFGPVLGPDYSTSILLVRRLMDGEMPGVPDLAFGVVDVRDVVDLHLRAMTDPAAAGERFLATSGDRAVTILEMATALREGLGEAAAHVPRRQLPNWVVRLAGLFDPSIRAVAPGLGKRKHSTDGKSRRVLGWEPRSPAQSILATAESLIELGLLERSGG